MGRPITQERLEKYIGLEAEMEDLRERVARKSAEAQFPPQKQGNESQHQPGTGDRRERGIIDYIMDGDDAEAQIKAIEAEKAALEKAVAALPDPMERLVLRRRYFDSNSGRRVTWPAVAKKIYGKDEEKYRKAAQRLHNSAIEHLAMVDIEREKENENDPQTIY